MSAPGDLHSNPEFQAYYQRELKPLEGQFEGHRTDARRELMRRAAAAIPGVAVAVAIGIWLLRDGDSPGPWIYFFLILVAAVLLAVWAAAPLMAHVGRLKIQVMPRLVPFFGDLSYQWSPELSLHQFEDSGALPIHTRAMSRTSSGAATPACPLPSLRSV